MKNLDQLFSTKRLKVVRAKEDHIHAIMAMERDKENCDFVWSGTYQAHKEEIDDKNYELLIFIGHDDDFLVGFALLFLDLHSQKCELRRFVIKEKGKGFGKEIMKGLLKYTFEYLKFNRFWLDVYPDNPVAINLYESLGLTKEGILRQNYKSNRGYLDQIIYSMLKKEYMEKYN